MLSQTSSFFPSKFPNHSSLPRGLKGHYREPIWARELVSSVPASDIDLDTLVSLAHTYHSRVSSSSVVLVKPAYGSESIMSIPVITRFSPQYSRRLIKKFNSTFNNIPASHQFRHFLTFTVNPSNFPSLVDARRHLLSVFHKFTTILYRDFRSLSSGRSTRPYHSPNSSSRSSDLPRVRFLPLHPKPIIIRTCEFQLQRTNQIHIHCLVSGISFFNYTWLYDVFGAYLYVKTLNDYDLKRKRSPASYVRDYLCKYIFKSLSEPFHINNVLSWALRLRRYSISGLSLSKSKLNVNNCNKPSWVFLRSVSMGASYGVLDRSSWYRSLDFLRSYVAVFCPNHVIYRDVLDTRPLWDYLCHLSTLDLFQIY